VSQEREGDAPGAVRWPFWARWIHTYVSLAGFGAVLFFAVTGITLNHADWFERAEPVVREGRGELPRSVLPERGEVDPASLARAVRASARVGGELASFSADGEACSLVLKGPAYAVDVQVDRVKSEYHFSEKSLGAMAYLDDLHKGRDSGPVWAAVIDLCGVVMAAAALTGLWLLLYVRGRRTPGLWVTAVGAVALALAAALAVA